ncbi:MAG: trypsin-like peptidase domain-containing protein [Granulosicoccus sp.]
MNSFICAIIGTRHWAQRLALILPMVLFFCLPLHATYAADVLLMADGVRGQGTLQKRGEECLVITPRHVVESAAFGIVATFPDRREVAATVLEMYAEDIALLRLEKQPSMGCSERAFNEEGLPVLLDSVTEGVLKRRDESGAASLLQVDIEGYDEHRLIRVEPRSSSKSIKQGYSGSVLFISNQPVGMLINNENSDGEIGLVLRAEMLNSTVGPFFQAAQRDRTFHISVDATSEFLLSDFQAMAREQNLALGSDPSETTFDLKVTSNVRNLETDTDKIVEYAIQLVIIDALERIVVNESIEALGNSFVSLQNAQQNAKNQLLVQLRQSEFLSNLQ